MRSDGWESHGFTASQQPLTEEATPLSTPQDRSEAAVSESSEASEKAALALASALQRELRRHGRLYEDGRPAIGDERYDELFQLLRMVEAAYPGAGAENSPTRAPGTAVAAESFETARHVGPMLSLDSSADEADLARFHGRIGEKVETPAYSVQPKLDGVSIELVYEGGVFVRAVTRGNGLEGDVVTANMRRVSGLPLQLSSEKIPVPEMLSVRGEVMMYISDFERYNEGLTKAGDEPYVSPRNSAAGALRQLDPAKTHRRNLHVCGYDLLGITGGPDFTSYTEVLAALESWGFRLPERIERLGAVDEIVAYRSRIERNREKLEYEIDGIVVKLDDLEARRELGSTSHHPRWAFAYKFPPRKAVTWVKEIEVQLGRTGVVTPVAHLVDTVIGGVTVRRASLHNREELVRKDIRVGDRVVVQRAGDVIPQVVSVVERSEPFVMPDKCPSCGAGIVEDGPRSRCPNRFGCVEQLKGRLLHYGSRAGLDIEGLGKEVASSLVDEGLVATLADLYALTAEELEKLEGFAARSAEALVASVGESRNPPLDRFLVALGIPEVGAAVARSLALQFGKLEALRTAEADELEEMDGIGPKMSAAITGFFSEPRNAEAIDALLARGVTPVSSARPALGAVVFTGRLPVTRTEAGAIWESTGGSVASSVSQRIAFLVAGEGAGSKAAKAAALGVETVDWEAFLERVELARSRGEAEEAG